MERDEYILMASRYIHLNPVKAEIVKYPEEYEWSSYNMYIGEKEERLISSERILSFFDGKSIEPRKLYREYVEGSN